MASNYTLIDLDGALAFHIGDYQTTEPIIEHKYMVTGLPCRGGTIDYSAMVGQPFVPGHGPEWRGSIYTGQGSWLEADFSSAACRIITSDTPRPRDGRTYTYEWDTYFREYKKVEYPRCDTCRKYHNPALEHCARCEAATKKGANHCEPLHYHVGTFRAYESPPQWFEYRSTYTTLDRAEAAAAQRTTHDTSGSYTYQGSACYTTAAECTTYQDSATYDYIDVLPYAEPVQAQSEEQAAEQQTEIPTFHGWCTDCGEPCRDASDEMPCTCCCQRLGWLDADGFTIWQTQPQPQQQATELETPAATICYDCGAPITVDNAWVDTDGQMRCTMHHMARGWQPDEPPPAPCATCHDAGYVPNGDGGAMCACPSCDTPGYDAYERERIAGVNQWTRDFIAERGQEDAALVWHRHYTAQLLTMAHMRDCHAGTTCRYEYHTR